MESFPEEISTIIFGHLDIDSLSNAIEANERWIPIIKTVLKSNHYLDICTCNINKILKLKGKFHFKNIRIKNSEKWHRDEGQFNDVLKIIADSRSQVRKLVLDGLHEGVVVEILNICHELTHLHIENMLKNADDTGMNPRRRRRFEIGWSRSCLARADHHKYLNIILQLIDKEESGTKTDLNLEASRSEIEDDFEMLFNQHYSNMLVDSDESPENSDFQFELQVQDILHQARYYGISNQIDPKFTTHFSQSEPNYQTISSQVEPNHHASSSQVEPHHHASSSQVEPNHHASSSQVEPNHHASSSQVEPNHHASSSQVETNHHASSSQVEPNHHASSSQIEPNHHASTSQLEPHFNASSSQFNHNFTPSSRQAEPYFHSGWTQDIPNYHACSRQVVYISSDESSEEFSSTNRDESNQDHSRGKRPMQLLGHLVPQKKIRKPEKYIEIPTLKYFKVKKAQNIFDIIRAPNLKSLSVIIFNPLFNHYVIQQYPDHFNQTLEKATKFIKIQNFIKATEKLKVLVLNKLNVNCLLGFEPYPFKLDKLSITTHGSDEFNSMFPPTQATYFYESILRLLEHQRGSLQDVSIESKFLKFSRDQILTIMEDENMSKLSVDARQDDNNLIDFKFDKSSKELKFFGGLNFENEFVELISRFPETSKLNLNVKGLLPIDALRIINDFMPNLTFLSINPFFTKISEDFKFEMIEKLEVHDLREKCGSIDLNKIVHTCPNIIELSHDDKCFTIKTDKYKYF